MAIIVNQALLLCAVLFGRDFGTRGHTFPIEEQDLLSYLTNRVKALSEQERQDIDTKVKDHYVQGFQNPKPVENLAETTFYSVHYFDPTVRAHQTITDRDGNCIVEKGMPFNPLSRYSLKKNLLFFDSTKASHLAWARTQSASSTWILVRGRPLELEEAENRPVYFDQHGLLSEKFKLTHIPARISQEGLKLKIEALVIKENGCEIR